MLSRTSIWTSCSHALTAHNSVCHCSSTAHNKMSSTRILFRTDSMPLCIVLICATDAVLLHSVIVWCSNMFRLYWFTCAVTMCLIRYSNFEYVYHMRSYALSASVWYTICVSIVMRASEHWFIYAVSKCLIQNMRVCSSWDCSDFQRVGIRLAGQYMRTHAYLVWSGWSSPGERLYVSYI